MKNYIILNWIAIVLVCLFIWWFYLYNKSHEEPKTENEISRERAAEYFKKRLEQKFIKEQAMALEKEYSLKENEIKCNELWLKDACVNTGFIQE
jgi:uncharacterized membrane protein